MHKILIGIPVHNSKIYCIDVFLRHLFYLIQCTRANKIVCDVAFTINSEDMNYLNALKNSEYYSEEFKILPSPRTALNVPKDHVFQTVNSEKIYLANICHARNTLREWCLINEYDFLFMLDADGVCEWDTIAKLLSLDSAMSSPIFAHRMFDTTANVITPIVSIRNENGEEVLAPHSYGWDKNINFLFNHDAGFGAVLIKRDTLIVNGNFNYPIDSKTGEILFSEDCYFFNKLRANNIDNIIDPHIRTIHFCDHNVFPRGYCNDGTMQDYLMKEMPLEIPIFITLSLSTSCT